ncbi:MAG: 2-dehydro-3-deoxy-D-gluconate 5-dehydrogenase KduD [Anaeroplasmataceae bacterium]
MVLDLFKLTNKVAIITGANTGLGQKMCVALAEAGAYVCGVARRDCSETKALIEDGKFYEIIADLSIMSNASYIVAEVMKKFGRIDILVNNAGMILREDTINVKEEDFDLVYSVNEKMVFMLSQEVGKIFIAQKSGKIINIASMLSFQGGIRVASYAASKHAVAGLTKAMANEWAKYNINVNAIAPGYMETNNTKNLRADEQRSNEILSRIPAGRWGTNNDMMGAVVYLASDASNYVNGHILCVDGGWMAR